MIEQWLFSHGYRVIDFIEIRGTGATQCHYYQATLYDGQKLFIKIGEKVGREIANLTYLHKQSIPNILPIFHGSNTARQILITEWVPLYNAGYDMVESYHAKRINQTKFLKFQEQCFSSVHNFYNISISTVPKKLLKYPQSLQTRIRNSLSKLRYNQQSIDASLHAKMKINAIIKLPIIYKNKILPSIESICTHIEFLISQYSTRQNLSILHGDFHPPNIVFGSAGEVSLVDMADISYGEHPCWDLGKWLNYVKRFHLVTATRRTVPSDQGTYCLDHKNSLLYIQEFTLAVGIEVIDLQALNFFSNMTGSNINELRFQETLSEVVVNLFTLPRHARYFPHVVPRVLTCIADAYQNLLLQL